MRVEIIVEKSKNESKEDIVKAIYDILKQGDKK